MEDACHLEKWTIHVNLILLHLGRQIIYNFGLLSAIQLNLTGVHVNLSKLYMSDCTGIQDLVDSCSPII